MGQIRKVGDTYYIEFFARGLMYSQIAGPDRVAAEQLLVETERKIADGEALTIVRHIDLAVFALKFIDHVRLESGVRTAARFEAMWAHFTAFLNKTYPDIRTLSQITPSVCETYKASRRPSTKPHLVNFTLLLLREALEYGIKLGFINDNPSLHVRLLSWPARQHIATPRFKLATELLTKDLGLQKACKLLSLTDIARTMYYANAIPLSREDIYR